LRRRHPDPLIKLALLSVAAVLVACRAGEAKAPVPSVPPVAAAARLERQYNARNDSTVVRVVPPVPPSGAHLIAGAVVDGRQARQAPEQVLIGVSWGGSEVRFAHCQRLRWRADGTSLAEVEVTRDVQIGGGVTEILSGTVSFPQVRALAATGQLSVDVCGEAVAIPDAELELLRQLVRQVSPGGR